MFMDNKDKIKPISEVPEVINWQNLITYFGDTIKRVEEILEYSEKEKEKIDELMKIVFKIDKLRESWKPIANTMNYNIFILSYKNLDNRLKKHFIDIYKELIIEVWTFKINRTLNNPLSSWKYDISWIKAEILNILSVDSNFDFWIFNNILVLQLVEEIKN